MSHTASSSCELVRVRGELSDMVLRDVAVDPFLLLQARRELNLAPWVGRGEALGCLGHRILAKPADLRAHVQRILLLVKEGDAAALYSALMDLMIVLGERGHALKQRMLDAARPLLAPATVAFFQEHLDRGVPADAPQATRAKGALLRAADVKGVPLVKRNVVAGQRIVSVMEQANALLEYGQLEQTVELLEGALLQNPDQESEAELLLGLYRTLREEERWLGMREQLQISFGRLPAAWVEAPLHF